MKRAAALALLLVLTACSAADGDDPTVDPDESAEPVELTFRTWDPAATAAYTESFDAFTAENPHITVTVDVVDEGEYWEQADEDIAAGEMADVYWINSANIRDHSDSLILIENPRDDWEKAVVELFTIDDELWAVPQMWNSVALYYNRDLYESDTRVEDLTWSSDSSEDTLIATAQRLTVDADGETAESDDFDADNIEQYGFASDVDLRSTFIPFLNQAGGQFQAEDGTFAFASTQGEEAIQYLVDLTAEHRVSPGADLSSGEIQDLFTSGRVVLYQSDSTELTAIASESDFSWAIAPIIGGPAGKISVVDGVAAAGNSATPHPEETRLLLEWLGTARAQDPIASHGITFPANLRAQDTYVNYWAKEGVDVSVFIESSTDAVTISGHDHDIHPALEEIAAYQESILSGDIPVAEGLEKAEKAGNEALR